MLLPNQSNWEKTSQFPIGWNFPFTILDCLFLKIDSVCIWMTRDWILWIKNMSALLAMVALSAVQSSTGTLFTLLAMITLSTVQSSTQTIHNTSNDRPFDCPIIYMDTIHIISNDHSFGCPNIYMDTIHSTSNDRSFNCPIIYTNYSQYQQWSPFWLSNHLHGYYSQYYYVIWHLQHVWLNQAHWLIGTPYLWIISSNETLNFVNKGSVWENQWQNGISICTII